MFYRIDVGKARHDMEEVGGDRPPKWIGDILECPECGVVGHTYYHLAGT